MAEDTTSTLTELTVELLSAFVANNNVRSEDLPALITATHAALTGLNAATEPASATTTPEETFIGVVTVRKSLGSCDHIISMIDGKPYKTLKRHLSGYGLTPDEYRSRYGLPSSYAMVAPAYSEQRRETARCLGLGRKPAAPPIGAAPASARGKPDRKPQVAKTAEKQAI